MKKSFTKIFLSIGLSLLITIGFISCDSGLTLSEIPKLLVSEGAEYDKFGTSVSISGDFAIVGASGTDTSIAYVYHKVNDTWELDSELQPSDGGSDSDYFGDSVAISGNFAIVGAFGNDCAYIFERDDTNGWDNGTKIIASSGTSGNQFGYSVSISGDYAIVGARNDGENELGSAYIYERSIAGWDNGTKILATSGKGYDNFGSSVAISGNYAIVGASGADCAYIYERDDTSGIWDTTVTKILASDGSDNDHFGCSVAISTDLAIVGAFNNSDGDDNNLGSAYIYEKDDTNGWDSGTKILASDGADNDKFGDSVAINGDYAIVGAIFNDDNGVDSGSAYIYKKDTTGWDTGTKILHSDGTEDDFFGSSVAISESYYFVGSTGYDGNATNSGCVYYYTID